MKIKKNNYINIYIIIGLIKKGILLLIIMIILKIKNIMF